MFIQVNLVSDQATELVIKMSRTRIYEYVHGESRGNIYACYVDFRKPLFGIEQSVQPP